MAAKTTHVEYQYCTVCRRNHNDGRKHIFTQQHKAKLSEIIKKFSKKIRDARRLLQKPHVIDGELEPGAALWCYCCQEEVLKHVTDGLTTVEWGGLLEHMASSSHHKKTRHFWWVNGADKTQLQNFILFQAELDRFNENVAEKLHKLNSERERKLKEEAKKIEHETELRSQIALEPPQVISGSHCMTTPSIATPIINTTGSNNRSSGNVHTGAIPPWMRDDDDDDGNDGCYSYSTPAGPSEDDFIIWKDKVGKGKRNPKRVGADFHHQLRQTGQLDKDDDNWLPSFGRVWNQGPRLHSLFNGYRLEFKNEFKTSQSDAVQPVQPYVSKRTSLKRPHPGDD